MPASSSTPPPTDAEANLPDDYYVVDQKKILAEMELDKEKRKNAEQKLHLTINTQDDSSHNTAAPPNTPVDAKGDLHSVPHQPVTLSIDSKHKRNPGIDNPKAPSIKQSRSSCFIDFWKSTKNCFEACLTQIKCCPKANRQKMM